MRTLRGKTIYAPIPYVKAKARIQGSLWSAKSKTTKTMNQTLKTPNTTTRSRCTARLSNLTIVHRGYCGYSVRQSSYRETRQTGRVSQTSTQPVNAPPLAFARLQVLLLDREDRAHLDLDVPNRADAPGQVGEFGVIRSGRNVGDAQALVVVNRAILVVLALIRTPIRGA